MEKGDKNLRELLSSKTEELSLEQRQKILIGGSAGYHYLVTKCGIKHYDMKPENIVIKYSDAAKSSLEAKLIDFGLVHSSSKNEAHRRMGYTCHGSKFMGFTGLCLYSSKKKLFHYFSLWNSWNL